MYINMLTVHNTHTHQHKGANMLIPLCTNPRAHMFTHVHTYMHTHMHILPTIFFSSCILFMLRVGMKAGKSCRVVHDLALQSCSIIWPVCSWFHKQNYSVWESTQEHKYLKAKKPWKLFQWPDIIHSKEILLLILIKINPIDTR